MTDDDTTRTGLAGTSLDTHLPARLRVPSLTTTPRGQHLLLLPHTS